MNRLVTLKHNSLKYFFSWFLQFLSSRSDKALIFLTHVAERLAAKDYYRREIRHIRHLFLTKHPSLEVVRRIMGDINPHHRRKLVETFVINQLLVGTETRHHFSKQPHGFYPPGFTVISPTMKCNLSCFGCYSAQHQKRTELTFEQFDSILSQQKEMGMYFSVISGGEPFVYKDLLEIFSKHSDIAFLVYTNGSMLTAETIGKLADLGNILPCISVEGFEAETDERRGKGHYQKVMSAFENLERAGLLYGFSATQTRLNSEILTSDEYIDIFIEKGCILGWFFHYIPVGRSPQAELMPTPEQRHHLRERIAYFRETKPILLGDFHNDGPVVGGCIAAGRKYFHVNAQGDIEPCVFFQYSTHNITTSSLQDALRSDFFQAIKQGQRSNSNLLRPCTLIDRPEISRSAISCHHAVPSHHEADDMFTTLKDDIDSYSQAYGTIADAAWDAMPHTRAELLQQKEELFLKKGSLASPDK
ncbi:radical SAM protein [candidate division CSSED10-310 bacterium]|uniref:Radical SAM protein n=1 Tax=candidate division CSSED10-310 bacterium TaxID=2855610 RepID=A0ABV6Z0T8_UNCC1